MYKCWFTLSSRCDPPPAEHYAHHSLVFYLFESIFVLFFYQFLKMVPFLDFFSHVHLKMCNCFKVRGLSEKKLAKKVFYKNVEYKAKV